MLKSSLKTVFTTHPKLLLANRSLNLTNSKVTGQIWHEKEKFTCKNWEVFILKNSKISAVSGSWQSMKSLSVLQTVVKTCLMFSYISGQLVQQLLKDAGPPQTLLVSGHQIIASHEHCQISYNSISDDPNWQAFEARHCRYNRSSSVREGLSQSYQSLLYEELTLNIWFSILLLQILLCCVKKDCRTWKVSGPVFTNILILRIVLFLEFS